MVQRDSKEEIIKECMSEKCSKSFSTKSSVKIYCSSKCRQDAKTKKNKSKVKGWREERLKKPGYKELENEKARIRSRKLKDWINSYKIESGCVDCGYNDHAVALDFDHMDGKTSNISSLKSIKAVLEEIDRHNCVVRCSNCHRVKTFETKPWIINEVVLPDSVIKSLNDLKEQSKSIDDVLIERWGVKDWDEIRANYGKPTFEEEKDSDGPDSDNV